MNEYYDASSDNTDTLQNDSGLLYDMPEDNTTAIQPTEDDVVPVEQMQQPADNWQVRASYFQSEYDKLKNVVEPYVPVIKLLNERPELIDTLINQVKPQEQVVEQAPQRPDKPQKPSDYNPIDAYSEPESPSYKYREAMENYQDALADYITKIEEKRTARETELQKREQEYLAQQQQVERAKQVFGEVGQVLTTQYRMSNQDAEAFIRDMSSPDSLSLDNLVALWKIGKTKQQVSARPANNQPPPPIFGGSGNRTTDANQAFSELLRQKV